MTKSSTGTAALRRLKKIRQKKRIFSHEIKVEPTLSNDKIDVDYVLKTPVELVNIPGFENVLKKFSAPTDIEEHDQYAGDLEENDSDSDSNNDLEVFSKSSNKKNRKLSQMTLASLKRYAPKPELVEWEDVTSKDPKLLVRIKAIPHCVPVPGHWSQKRKYLAGKRGFIKPPFTLPAFIRDTGIGEQRELQLKKESEKTVRQKARDRRLAKLGGNQVEYSKLYDAFFKYQTRPPLTQHGDLYWEGRGDFGGIVSHTPAIRNVSGHLGGKPGFLSEDLRSALGIENALTPPPWLHAMQRFGAPPAYSHLRIPGLNAPLPKGAQWGFHAGGWGRPPPDASSLIFGDEPTRREDPAITSLLNPVIKNLWGELEPEEDDDDSEKDSDDSDLESEPETGHMAIDEESAAHMNSMVTPDGRSLTSDHHQDTSSFTSAYDIPEILDTRKRAPR